MAAAQKPAFSTIWSPQPRQAALISCPVFEVFFGGARGGGKTEASLGDWAEHSARYGEAAVGIFVRRKLTQLSEVIARSKQLYSRIGAKYNEQAKTWTMPGGGRLKFVYLEQDKDAEEYQGHSYTRVYIEEVTNFPSPAPIMKLKATLRSAAGVPCGMRLTGNPGGPGHNWVKSRYIDPAPGGFKVIQETDSYVLAGELIDVMLDRVFIPSKITDNELLLRSDPTYILRLKQSGSEALVRAWLEGDWSVIDGAFFSEFDSSIHVLDTFEWLPRIPPRTVKFRSFDWGSAKPFSVGWYAVADGTWQLPKGAILKYREWYGSKGPNVGLKLDAAQVAQGIAVREQNEVISYGVADPAIFTRDGGPSIGEIMAINKVVWRRADNKRIPGWEQLHYRLRGESGQPMLYFLDCCVDSIRTIPTLQHDDINSEDVDTEGEDHAGDETRYAVMSRPWIPRVDVSAAARMPLLPNQMTFKQLMAAKEQQRLLASQR